MAQLFSLGHETFLIFMDIIQTIKQDLKKAAEDKHKIAAFHSSVLLHADSLSDFDPAEFCRLVEVPATYKTEFLKMLAVARRLDELGYSIQKK